MGRPRIHPADATYEDKFGSRDQVYSTKARTVTPKFKYQLYIKREHWKTMDKVRMMNILLNILPHLSSAQQLETSFIIAKLKR